MYRILCSFLFIGFLACCLVAGPAPATASQDRPGSRPQKWLTTTTDHFLIYYTAKDAYFSQELSALAERSYARVTDYVGLHPKNVITIYLAGSKEAFSRRQPFPSPVGEEAVGLAYPGLCRILLLSPRAAPQGSILLEKTFVHELTHVVLGATPPGGPSVPIPLWFNEGLSMYVAEEWNWQYQALMTRLCITGSIIPFPSLNHSFPRDRGRLQTAYAQSMSLISFILNKYGQDSLQKITRSLVRGQPINQAMQEALGFDLGELELRWRKHLRIVYTWVPILTSSFVLWFIISLIFLMVYYRKKQTSQAKISAWQEDEVEDWLRKQLDDLNGW